MASELAFDAEGGGLPDERGECNRCNSGSRGPSQLSSPYERRRERAVGSPECDAK